MSQLSRRGRSLRFLIGGCLWLTGHIAGCTDLRGRRHIREGNRLYREGHYTQALEHYREAEQLVPALPLLWLNMGLTCRQLMTPGAQSAAHKEAVDCALASFETMKRVVPNDPRGEQLYVQTLFDADRFETLIARYEQDLKKNPGDLNAINGIIQVHSRSHRIGESLPWYQRKAALLPNDAEAQYAVGVVVWQQLFQRGGGPDKAAYDPRVDPNGPEPGHVGGKAKRQPSAAAPTSQKVAPSFALGDITGTARSNLADVGIKYLERALVLRPDYQEVMVYLNLLYRQKAMAYFDKPEQWQATVDVAEKWRRQAAETLSKRDRAKPKEAVPAAH